MKVSVPQAPILQFFIETCGLSNFINFAELKLPKEDELFRTYTEAIKDRFKGYRCGEIRTLFKGFVCGYFRTGEENMVKKGEELEYLGIVREERHMVKVSQLLYSKDEWLKLLEENDLVSHG